MDVVRAQGSSRPRRIRPSVRVRVARTGVFWIALGTAGVAVSGCGHLVSGASPGERPSVRSSAIAVTGPTGPSGVDGRNGVAGVGGAVGPQGATGPVGPVGPTGMPGATGPAGATGLPGLPGVPGVPGADGAAGRDGVAGVAGIDGAPGATGPQGATGPSGVNTFMVASIPVTAAGLTATTASVSCPSGSVGVAPSWSASYSQVRVLDVSPSANGATWTFRLYNGATTPDPSVVRVVCVVGSYGT